MNWTQVRDKITTAINNLTPLQLVLKRIVDIGTLNPETGSFVFRTEQSFTVYAIRADAKHIKMVGGVESDDWDLIVTASGETPKVGDLIGTINDFRDVVQVQTVQPADVALVHMVKLRG